MDFLVPALAFPLSRYRREFYFEQKTRVAPRAKAAARSTRRFPFQKASIDKFFYDIATELQQRRGAEGEGAALSLVMPDLVPGIHVFSS